MEDNRDFLRYIYNEELYIIDEPVSIDHNSNNTKDMVADKQMQEQVAKPVTKVEDATPISYFGNNEKGILILVEDHSEDLLNQNDLDLLMKIVESGLKHSKNDFALVNTAKFPIEQILDEISYSYLISFGVDLSDFFSDTTSYTIHK